MSEFSQTTANDRIEAIQADQLGSFVTEFSWGVISVPNLILGACEAISGMYIHNCPVLPKLELVHKVESDNLNAQYGANVYAIYSVAKTQNQTLLLCGLSPKFLKDKLVH